MFSEELYIMDRNAERLMVTELEEAVAAKDSIIAEKDNTIAEQAALIAQLQAKLAEQTHNE